VRRLAWTAEQVCDLIPNGNAAIKNRTNVGCELIPHQGQTYSVKREGTQRLSQPEDQCAPMDQYEYHRFANLFPMMMDREQFEEHKPLRFLMCDGVPS
jgi:hypothetical protein